MARKTKLTTETIDMLCRGIRMGMTIDDAARMANISKSTYYDWKKKAAKARSGRLLEFSSALEKAQVEAKALLLKRIHDAASGNQVIVETREVTREGVVVEVVTTTKQVPGHWKASAWILERRWPDEWGPNQKPVDDQHSTIDDLIVIIDDARVQAGVDDKPVGPSSKEDD